MPEPIIIDGHSQKITITLPTSFKLAKAGEGFTIEVEADPGKPFQHVVVRDVNKQERFRTPEFEEAWHIRIGRDETEPQ